VIRVSSRKTHVLVLALNRLVKLAINLVSENG